MEKLFNILPLLLPPSPFPFCPFLSFLLLLLSRFNNISPSSPPFPFPATDRSAKTLLLAFPSETPQEEGGGAKVSKKQFD